MSSTARRMERLRILVVDDHEGVRLGLRALLVGLGAEVREASSGEDALKVLGTWVPHVLLSDIVMGAFSGMDLLLAVRRERPEVRVLLMTGFGTIEQAVEAMRCGAANFISKPFDNTEVLAEVERLGEEALAIETARSLRARLRQGGAAIVAADPRMLAVLDLVTQLAPTRVPVLIRGESGTGKELVARALHVQSDRASLPFLAVNSAALPDTLLESELFGHHKGAFTGADRDREGLFLQARGGTVFLDEIALMSLAFQAKLLRVLQEQKVTPLGSSASKSVSFRLVTASNRSLRQLIAEGKFREDLYYRLQVATITVPPLRERPLDILPLARHFLSTYAEGSFGTAGFSGEALAALERHRWPGNVRELENTVQRALILARGGEIRARHLGVDEESQVWPAATTEEQSYEEGKQRALERYQRRAVEKALAASRGNVTQAALSCGLTRAAFQRLMRRLALDRNEMVGDA